MNITDPIADLLTRIRNAQKAKHEVVVIPASRVKIAIVHLLKKEGYLKAYKCVRDGKQGLIKVALKYIEGVKGNHGVINSLKRESKPGRRKYCSVDELPVIKNGFGISILSTSQGIMTSEDAKSRKVGGEYLCSVY